ncbi:MAG: 30S ribosomal protein S17e [Nanoarchaeota archaeon]
MGRIKSTLTKRTAEKLIQEQDFSEQFGENKKILGMTMPSKRMRNVIAGYISRLVRRTHAKQKSL